MLNTGPGTVSSMICRAWQPFRTPCNPQHSRYGFSNYGSHRAMFWFGYILIGYILTGYILMGAVL